MVIIVRNGIGNLSSNLYEVDNISLHGNQAVLHLFMAK